MTPLGILRGVSFSSFRGSLTASSDFAALANTARNGYAPNVGYMDAAMRQGNRMFAPMFETVNEAGTFSINDLTVKGFDPFDPESGEGGTSGDIIIKVLNKNGGIAVDEDGNELSFSFWDNEDTSDDGEGTGAGWYRDMMVSEDTKVTDVTFDVGLAFWVQGIDGLYITTAGGVKITEAVIPMRQGNVGSGNPFPVVRDLATEMSVTGYDEFDPGSGEGGTSGDIIIKILNKNGGIDKDDQNREMSWSFWDNEDTSDDGEGTGAGWYRDMMVSEDTKVNDVSIPAGQGMWIQGIDNLFLHIKAPELD